VLADFFLLSRGNYSVEEMYKAEGRYGYWKGLNLRAITSWAGGALVYYLIIAFAQSFGATLPSLCASALIHYLLMRRRR